MVAPEHLTLFNFNSEHNRDLLKKYSRSSERLYDGARLPPEVHKILLHTLERYDGEGYPDGLKGDDIPLGSRIIATIDALLHLLNFEGYENFKSSFDIILSLKEKYFDPEIVDIVEEIILDLFIDELSPRAIIIDTNPEELEHLSVLLKKNGIFPYPLKDTEKVIAILDSSPVCLIVSEVNTKPLDGFSICDLVKTNDKYRNINFVFLSEKNDSATVSKGFDAGADDFITKPYNPSILIAKIQNFIKHSLRKTEEKAKTASTKKGITGNLAEIHVTDLIQMLFAGGKTGALKLFKEDENGEVFFNQGQVINARYKHVEGVAAFNLLVRWGHGLFILDPDAQLLDQIIFYSTEMLLIEACRVWDEEKQGAL
jgi:response regulator RpfG family c-di-GMP phosphodiesterase